MVIRCLLVTISIWISLWDLVSKTENTRNTNLRMVIMSGNPPTNVIGGDLLKQKYHLSGFWGIARKEVADETVTNHLPSNLPVTAIRM